ncbi:hypothetical protein [Streptomyces sp. NPDC048623]|uniref:hypothetical protein n=1 Tax=Streptomyces sp. NPDC048623 TaxID=3155761 RepID=UPI00342DDFC7
MSLTTTPAGGSAEWVAVAATDHRRLPDAHTPPTTCSAKLTETDLDIYGAKSLPATWDV